MEPKARHADFIPPCGGVSPCDVSNAGHDLPTEVSVCGPLELGER